MNKTKKFKKFRKFRKFAFLLFAAILIIALTLASCGDSNSAPKSKTSNRIYIAIVSKGFQHQFWQTVYAGSKAAAEELDVDITFEGPPSEAEIDTQLAMVGAALDKNPDALCLAAIDVNHLNEKLLDAKNAKIPVIGFDSGIPGAPEGIIFSTASTNNYAAGELAAVKMFEESTVKARIMAATADNPVVIGVLSQDAISPSIVDRTKGFVDKFRELSEGVHSGAVEISGHDLFIKPAAGKPAVIINVVVSPTPNYSDNQISAENLFNNTSNLISIFCSNEGTVTGLLAATNDGEDLARDSGKYKDVVIIGFDAGVSQKQAIKKQYIYGSITQDPYQIGYLAVELAYKAIKGEKLDAVVDTGCKFYNYENIDSPDIAQLVYD